MLNRNDNTPRNRKIPWTAIGVFVSVAGIIGPIFFHGNNRSISPRIVNSANTSQQNQTGDNGNQTLNQFEGSIGSVTVNPRVQGDFDGAAFISKLEETEFWEPNKNLSLKEGVLSIRRNRGQPEFFLTKEIFPQENTFSVWFIPRTKKVNVILRVENAFDVRPGDGGSDEASLHRFAEDGSWPEVPLVNPNTRRDGRFQFPCPIPVGQEIHFWMKVNAEGNHRKTVTMYFEYICTDGTIIDPQHNEPAIWTFTVPERTNKPSRFGVGLIDPDGFDKPKVTITRVEIDKE